MRRIYQKHTLLIVSKIKNYVTIKRQLQQNTPSALKNKRKNK